MRRALVAYDLITSSLSDNAFRVYAYLLVHANKNGECWPSLATVANETGRSRRSLDFAIAELKSKNFIESYRDGNQGKGQIRYVITELPSATDCAKSGSDQAQYVAPDNDGPSAKNDGPSAKSEATKRKKRQDLAQKTTIPPAPPYIGEQYNRTINRTKREENSLSENSSLEKLVPPKNEIPPKLLRMATALQLEAWLGHVQYQEISMDDWRIEETLAICQRNGKCNANYAWGTFKNLPEQKPQSSVSETNGYHRPRETYESMKQKADEDCEFITKLIRGEK